MSINFSTGMKYKKISFIMISVLITAVTLIMENRTQRFVDSLTFSLSAFGGLVVICLLLAVLRYIRQYLETNLEKNGNLEGQAQAAKTILSREYHFFEKSSTGSLLYNLTEDMYELMPWYAYKRIQLVLEAVNLLCLYAFMLWTDIGLALAALALVGLSLWCAGALSDRMGNAKNEQLESNGVLNRYMLNAGKSINTIRQLDKTSFFVGKYDDYIEEKYIPVVKRVIKIHTLYISQIIFSQEIIPFIMLFTGVVLTALGKSTIGNAIVMMDLTTRVSDSIQNIADILPQRSLSREIGERLKPVLTCIEEQGADRTPAGAFETMEIRINGYRNGPDGKKVLENTGFSLNRGDICVLKGASGSGKSTLAGIIAGLKKPDGKDGVIQYNGTDISGIAEEEYHRHVLLVNQDSRLLQGTVRDNLLLERQAEDEELDEIIRVCELQDFVKQYGLDYTIENAGGNISGGQKQRLAIARMLLRKPDVLILDEVTSALDKDMTEALVKNIVSYAREHSVTIIAISHKDDFEKYSDQIVSIG